MTVATKALSIARRGGTHIRSGAKTLDVRRWRPDLSPSDDLLIVENARLLHAGGDQDPAGRAVAIMRAGRVRPFLPGDTAAACASRFEQGWLALEQRDIRPSAGTTIVLAARGIYQVAFTPPGQNL